MPRSEGNVKEQTIAKMVKAGVGQDRAEKFYALFLSAMCGGIEPEAGDVFSREDIAAAFPGNVPARNALTAALCGEQAPKVKKYKPGRPCTAAEYAEHYDRDPENADLVADLVRATDGKPWVVFKDRFRVAESAKFVAWHMDEAIAPATILVDGVPVAPVMPGEERRKEAKEYPVDPHTPGGFLDVEGKSPRTGADFTGYTEEEIQATIMAYPKLVRMDDLSLQRLTEENRGKGATAILKPFSEIAAVWAARKPEDRPKTKATRAPRNPPPAGGDVAVSVGPVFAASPAANAPVPPVPLVVILGHETKAYASVRQALVPLQQAGILRMWSEKDLRAGEFVGQTVREKYTEAALFIALIDTYSLASLREVLIALIEAKRPVMPVIVGSCLWDMTDVARLSVLFPKQPYGTHESDNTTLAREVRSNLFAITNRNALADNVRPARLDINEVAAAIINGGLARSRGALLAGLPPDVVAGLSDAGSPSEQVYQDLGALQNMGQILDGSRPLAKYLRSAAMLAGPRREAQVFRDALRGLGES